MDTRENDSIRPITDSNEHILELLERRNRNLHRVNEVSQKLTSMLDKDQVMAYLLRASAEIIGAPAASLWMWQDNSRQALVCHATHPAETVEYLRPFSVKADEGVAGWVVANQRTAVTDNAAQDDRFTGAIDQQTGFNTESMLAVPLNIRGKCIGVIEILNKLSADFDEEDVTMVETLAAAAAIALENAHLVADLREKTEQLQQQNSELDAFAHTVAHDLKSPLSTVLGFSDFLQEIDFDMDKQELGQTIDVITRNAKKMNNIIQEILLLSGVRKAEVTIGPVAMQEVVQEAQKRLSHMLSEFDAAFIGPASWPDVIGYGPWVEEVWVNYISNALKYGGHPPVVELGYDIEDKVVWFWVKDNGQGLTKEQQDQLFVPFTRLEQVRVKGHGLGLSIVQRIVERLGGQIAIQSKLGVGSTFKFSLPLPQLG